MPKSTSDCCATGCKRLWPKVRLGDVGTLIRGKGIKRSETCATGKPCIRYGEIYTSFNVLLDKPRSFVDDALFDDCPHIKKGDLVLTLTGENKEEIAKTLCYLGDEEIAAGGDLAIWSGHGCDPKYLAYLMYSPAMIKAKADASNGHIVVHASVKKLQDIELPLPPLAEQKKIVEKVEKALKRVDALKAQFERMEKSAADYFKAALAETFAAVKGEKVELRTIGDVCMCKRVLKEQTTSVGEIPFYKIGTFGKKANAFISRKLFDEFRAKYSYPEKGDVLLSAAGTIGRAVFFDGEPAYFQDSNIVWLRHDGKKATNPYLYWCYQTSPWRITEGTTIHRLYNDDVLSAKIKLPSLEIQREVVKRLTEIKCTASRLEEAARRCIGICGKMRKAILAEAFQ